ncbi:MAG: class I SAM-dependent methyltransferase [Streptosporangiaceae bacterium]
MEAQEWDRRYAAQELLWSATPNQFVEAEFTGARPGRALDLACGEGRNAGWLAGLGWQVTAVDFSPVAVDRGRATVADTAADTAIEWIVADLTSWPIPEDAYDAVIVAYLHLPQTDMAAILGRATRALRPGGVLLFVGHDRSNTVGGPQDPRILHTPATVAGSLAGLEITRAESVPREVGDRFATDTLVRAVRPVSTER